MWMMRRQNIGLWLYAKTLVQIGGGKVGNIIKRIAKNDPDLTGTVELGGERVTNSHMRMLAAALKNNTVVSGLSLHSNPGISSPGVIALAETMKMNTRIRTLDLDYNRQIGENGGNALLDMLRADRTVPSTS